MKTRLAILTVTLIGTVPLAGCAETSTLGPRPLSSQRSGGGAARHPPTASSQVIDHDGDMDSQTKAEYDEDDYYGPPASPDEARAITAIARRYYALAASDKGASACSMIYWAVAEALSEEYNQRPQKVPHRASTCASVMTRLFTQEHSQLSAKVARLTVLKVLSNGPRAWIVMSFGEARKRHLVLRREPHGWSIVTPLDRGLP